VEAIISGRGITHGRLNEGELIVFDCTVSGVSHHSIGPDIHSCAVSIDWLVFTASQSGQFSIYSLPV